MSNTKHAGKIIGDPLIGLCERICIEVPFIIDGCVTRSGSQLFGLTVTDISSDAVYPFTFISCNNSGDVKFNNLSIISLDNGCSRITGEVYIPLIVTFRDAKGNIYTGKSFVNINRDIVLKLPKCDIPYTIRTAASFSCNTGSFANANTVNLQACYVIVNKVVVMRDVLVPSYGQCVYPDCTSCNPDPCENDLPLPLFIPTT